jgi:peroxiredoxin
VPRDVQVGDAAPTFRLRHTMDSTVALDELLARGAVLLVFYVFDFGRY